MLDCFFLHDLQTHQLGVEFGVQVVVGAFHAFHAFHGRLRTDAGTLAVMFSALTAGSLFHALRGKARTFGQHMEQRNDFLNLTKETMLFAKNHTNATRRCLKFIHIPKNAGSAIENLGYHLKYAWGLHDHSLHCLNASECSQTVPVRRLCCWPNNVTACSVWHYPPSILHWSF